jgi:hypothetical protein
MRVLQAGFRPVLGIQSLYRSRLNLDDLLANDVLPFGDRARLYRTYCGYCHFIHCWEKAPRRKSPCHCPMFYSGLDKIGAPR